VGYSTIHGDIVDYRLKGLQEMNLINKNKGGFTILNAGLDAFALKILVEKNIITGIGKPIGVGKESDVYKAVTDPQEERAGSSLESAERALEKQAGRGLCIKGTEQFSSLVARQRQRCQKRSQDVASLKRYRYQHPYDSVPGNALYCYEPDK